MRITGIIVGNVLARMLATGSTHPGPSGRHPARRRICAHEFAAISARISECIYDPPTFNASGEGGRARTPKYGAGWVESSGVVAVGAYMKDAETEAQMTNGDEGKREELAERYAAAMHGVQTGIKILLETGDDFASPKHLRVGVNSAMATAKGLADLLISKGVFTEEEYIEAMAVAAEYELALMTEEVRTRLGNPNISLA